MTKFRSRIIIFERIVPLHRMAGVIALFSNLWIRYANYEKVLPAEL